MSKIDMLFALIYFCNQGMLHKDSEADSFQNKNKFSVKPVSVDLRVSRISAI
jgi:hypothetical protein